MYADETLKFFAPINETASVTLAAVVDIMVVPGSEKKKNVAILLRLCQVCPGRRLAVRAERKAILAALLSVGKILLTCCDMKALPYSDGNSVR